MEASNVKAMRDALEKIASMGEQIDHQLGSSEETVYAFRHERCLAHNISECARAALSAPPRNCDVGTAEEQERRWHANCGIGIPNCKHCEVYEQARKSGIVDDKNMIRFDCRLIWGQMPYQEGESEGIVSEIIECDDSVADIVSNMRDYADRTEKQGLYDLRECGTEYLRALADLIEAANQREVAELERKVAELLECLRMAVVNARIARTCYAFGRECDSCGQSCNARKWKKVIEVTK